LESLDKCACAILSSALASVMDQTTKEPFDRAEPRSVSRAEMAVSGPGAHHRPLGAVGCQRRGVEPLQFAAVFVGEKPKDR
jgi:hypothetical protein